MLRLVLCLDQTQSSSFSSVVSSCTPSELLFGSQNHVLNRWSSILAANQIYLSIYRWTENSRSCKPGQQALEICCTRWEWCEWGCVSYMDSMVVIWKKEMVSQRKNRRRWLTREAMSDRYFRSQFVLYNPCVLEFFLFFLLPHLDLDPNWRKRHSPPFTTTMELSLLFSLDSEWVIVGFADSKIKVFRARIEEEKDSTRTSPNGKALMHHQRSRRNTESRLLTTLRSLLCVLSEMD